MGQPFPPTALRRRHAQTVRDSTSSYKIVYVIVIKNFLNPKGRQNPISGSKVTAILLKVWIFPLGGASAGEGLRLHIDKWNSYTEVGWYFLGVTEFLRKVLPPPPFLLLLSWMMSESSNLSLTAFSAARWNVELLQWKLVFKSPFWIQKLWKAKIWTEYLYDLMLHPITF